MTYIVRNAVADDVDEYIVLMEKFHRASPMNGVVDFSKESLVKFFMAGLSNDDLLIALAEKDGHIVGIVGAIAYPLYFNTACIASQELYWFVEVEHRNGTGKKLFKLVESWSKTRNATHLFMIALADNAQETMRKLYVRDGFVPMEHTYMKGI